MSVYACKLKQTFYVLKSLGIGSRKEMKLLHSFKGQLKNE